MYEQMDLGVDSDVNDLKIHAHAGDWRAERLYPEGSRPRWSLQNMTGVGLGDGMRGCSYCGSMHPLDLLDMKDLETISLSMANMKYGFPHKFYINGIPNPMAGQKVQVGLQSYTDEVTKEQKDEPIMDESSMFRNHKFHGVHMNDLLDDLERFVALAALIDTKTACLFYVNEGKVTWKIDRKRKKKIWDAWVERTKRKE